MLKSFVVTAQLICAVVFAFAKTRFSHEAAHMTVERFEFIKETYSRSQKAEIQFKCSNEKKNGFNILLVCYLS